VRNVPLVLRQLHWLHIKPPVIKLAHCSSAALLYWSYCAVVGAILGLMALVNLLGDQVVGGDGAMVDVTSLQGQGKVLGIYFSAHWCPPCR